jgi:hypothetical protein
MAPDGMGSCGPFVLDGNIVTGTGTPRSIVTYLWNVSLTNPTIASSQARAGIAAIRANLTDAANSFATRLILSPTMFTDYTSYTFAVRVTNFMGIRSLISTKVVTKVDYPTPTLTISAPSSTYRNSYSIVTFTPSLTFPSCYIYDGSWSWSWSLKKITLREGLVDPTGGNPMVPEGYVGQSGRVLVLPSMMLSTRYDYVLRVSASNQFELSVTATSLLSVLQSQPIAKINGGDRLVSPLVPLILDGSLSYDPDNSSSLALSYQWSCTILDLQGSPCGFLIAGIPSPSIEPNLVTPLQSYILTLTVTTMDDRSSSASVTITFDKVPGMNPVAIGTSISTAPGVTIIDGLISSDSILRLISTLTVQLGILPAYTR